LEENSRFLKLFNRDADLAWRMFLEQYSQMMLRYIRSRIRHYDDIMQVYISICEKLSANNYRVMKQFQGRRKSKLSTWLVIVIRSHCADWYRTRMGRKRYFRRLKKMTPIYRLAFRYFYWESMRFCEIVEQLKTAHGARGVSHRDISGILAAVNKEIGPQNIWRSVVSNRAGINHPARFDEDILPREKSGEDDLPCCISESEGKYLIGETTAIFESVLSFLNREEKQMLRLFFWENKTAKNIAGILDLDNEFVAYQKRDGILKRIKRSFEKLGFRFSDFSAVIEKMNIKID